METPDSARWPLAPERVLGTAILPWLHRALGERSTFSLLEVGTFNGLYSLELAARYPNATVVHLEPNGTLWEPHAALGVNRRLANALLLRNTVPVEVAEALAHSNEFFDAQLLLSLQTTKPFDHGVEVKPSKREQLDRFVAHLLSLARRTLLLLPAPSDGRSCRDGRLATWLHGAGGGGTSERLRAAAAGLGLRVSVEQLLRGAALDGCEYELWSARLLHMDRQNRHHYCEGGCKTHTRRTYRLLYTEAAGGAGAREWINMSNTQTGRRIPFETGSINLHSVLALHRQHPLPTLDGTRQMLMLMFLSLPVFQDPAPWNVVWRGGELFPIDVGDGLTLEERPKPEGKTQWEAFAQKYIGSLNDCYRMSLRTLCGESVMHGEERYEACMSSFFAGVCPAERPYPCLTGCNASFRGCAHIKPADVVPGYFRRNVHVVKHAARFALYHPPAPPPPPPPPPADATDAAAAAAAAATAVDAAAAEERLRFGLEVPFHLQRAAADRRRAKLAAAAEKVERASPPPPPPPYVARPPAVVGDGSGGDPFAAAVAQPSADGGGGGGGGAAGGGEGGDELRAGLALLGLPATDLGAPPPPIIASAAAAAASPRAAPRPTRKLAWVLTAVQLGLIGWVAALLCERYPSGRRMLRALRYSVSRSSRGGILT